MRGESLRLLRRLALVMAAPALVAACDGGSWGNGARPATVAAQPQRPTSVTVLAGDTVYTVARRYNLSVRDLIDANGLRPPYQLEAGTVLRLPGGGSDYVVQRGDALLVLARRFKVDFNTLAAVNNKKPPYTLFPGERLTIPGAGAPSGAVANAAPAGGGTVITSPNAQGGRRTVVAAAPPVQSSPAPAQPAAPVPQPAPQQTTQPATVQTAVAQTAVAVPPSPPARGGSGFLWPLKGEVLSEYGAFGKGQHNDGINIMAAKGTPVHAAESGVVAYVGNELKGFGNLLLIKHADGWMTAYAHNDTLMVKKGEVVKRGQPIATVGSSGSVSLPQLHFEIRKGTEAVNPLEYLRDPATS